MISLVLLGVAAVIAAGNGALPEKELCGAYCLYLGLKAIEVPVEGMERVQQELGSPPAGGYSLGQIDATARKFGAETLGVKTTFANLRLRKERFVCLAHLKENHFVLFTKIEKDGVIVIDPPTKKFVPFVTLQKDWNGNALLISPEPLLAEESLRSQFGWWMPALAVAIAVVGVVAIYFSRRVRHGK